MKQKIKLLAILLLLLLLPKAVLLAQTDTLMLVKQSRISFCNSKIEQVAILNSRLEVKDAEIVNLSTRLEGKDQQIASFNKSIQFLNEQLHISNSETSTVKQQFLEVKNENKQLRKKNFVQKIGLVAITVLCIWSFASN